MKKKIRKYLNECTSSNLGNAQLNAALFPLEEENITSTFLENLKESYI